MEPVEPLVTVIIPAYNAEATLAATLDSACRQTYRALEIIIVDDGSTDATQDIASRFAEEDPRIRVLRQSNAGVAAARNLAIAEARGEFIGPLDADDLWHPRKIELQLAAFRAGPSDMGLVYGWSVWIDEEDRLIRWGESRADHAGQVFATLILGNFVGNASAPLIRAACLREVGGYDTTLHARRAQGCEDHHLYLAIAERWRYGVVRAYLVGYRQTRTSMSRNLPMMLRSRRLVLDEWRQRRPDLPATLFRWSDGQFRTWLALRALHDKSAPAFARHFATAIRRDPSLLLETRLYRLIARDIGRHVRDRLQVARPAFKAKGAVSNDWQRFIRVPIDRDALAPRLRQGRLNRREAFLASLADGKVPGPQPQTGAAQKERPQIQ